MQFSLLLALLASADWAQFRGPNASGVSSDINLPAELRPDRNVVWQTPLPQGFSSPSVAGDRIFVTGVDGGKLLTIAMDRASGKILWRREAPRPRQQEMQRANSAASATPATDGTRVYSFFQDFGLIAYGPDGNELWRMPMGPFNNPFGHGSSPILTSGGGTLIMNIDQDTGSFLLALDAKSGKTLWRTPRDHAQRGYATPVLYGQQIIVIGSYRMSGYDLPTGREMWWIGSLPWQIKPTPVVQDGIVYFITFSGESDPGEQEKVPPFAEALKLYDVNKDGRISKEELPDPKARARFEEYLDLDHTGFLEERDWERFRDRRAGENALRAYKIEQAKGDITESGFLWKNAKTLPNVPSPLLYQGILYTLKEGGIFSSFDPKTGEVLKQGRLQGALGTYYASPVAADGKIYLANEEGTTVVLKAGAQWEILSVGGFDSGIHATPAITGGRIYLRTHSALYCLGKAAEVMVATSGAFASAYRELVPAIELSTHHKAVTVFGPSMGTAHDAIPQRLDRGEAIDVVIMTEGALAALIDQGKIRPGSLVELARSSIGMAIRSGVSVPDISSVEALRRTLLAAKSIAYSSSASGVYLSSELFLKLGIASQIKSKSRAIEGEPVGEAVARGEAEIGFQQISELLPVKGLVIVGPLPAGAQRVTVIAAGIPTASKQPEEARALIEFLASPASAAAIRKSGLEPVNPK